MVSNNRAPYSSVYTLLTSSAKDSHYMTSKDKKREPLRPPLFLYLPQLTDMSTGTQLF